MDALTAHNAQLQQENRTLRQQRDKFRQIATEAEAENARGRKELLELQIKYENERKRRVLLEMEAAGGSPTPDTTVADTGQTESPLSSKGNRKRVIVVEDENDNENDETLPVAKRQKMFVEIPKLDKTTPNIKVQLKPPSHATPVSQKKKLNFESPAKGLAKSLILNVSSTPAKEQSATASPSNVESAPRARRVIREASRIPLTLAEKQSLEKQSQSQRRILKKEAMSPKKEVLSTPKKEALLSPKRKQEAPASSKKDVNADTRRPSSSLSDAPSSPGPTRISLKSEKDTYSLTTPANTSEEKGKGKEKETTPPTANYSPLNIKISPRKPMKGGKEEGGWVLPPSEVSKYLGDAKSFRIETDHFANGISRQALTQKYGLPGMGFLWTSKDKKRRFMLPTYETNPDMPRAAGEPGLLLSCRDEMCRDGPWTLFVRTIGDSSKKVKWTYAGEYMCSVVGSLNKEEFISQYEAVKLVWGEKIAKHKKYPVYRTLRARMTLRKNFSLQNSDREPTQEEIDNEAALIRTSGYVSSLKQQDVVEVFERGDEKIGVVKLECVAYDNEKAREFNQVQDEYEERLRKKNLATGAGAVKKIGSKTKSRSLAKPGGGIKKAKSNAPPDTDNDHGDGDEGVDSGDEPVNILAQENSARLGFTMRPQREKKAYQLTFSPDSSGESNSEYDSSA